MVKTMRKVIVLHRLRFSDEIRSEKGLEIPDVEVKMEELKMTSMIISQITKLVHNPTTGDLMEKLKASLKSKSPTKKAS